MGTRRHYSRAVGPLPLLSTLLVLAVITKTVSSCRVDDCWTRYKNALDAVEEGAILPGAETGIQRNCIVLRTYHYCIKNITRGCFGNIKFHSVKKVVEGRMKEFNCSFQGPIFRGVPRSHRPSRPRDTICSYRGKRVHKHCGLFGDPHLRTFGDDFQTCKVQGAWPLIENEYLTVQVTNDPVVWDGSATATSKLTVVIKQHEECAASHFVMYQAQTDYLPGTFEDGRTHFGPEKSVQITEVDAGKHVEIYLRYIDTTLLVRQVGRYITFAIRMPDELVNASRNYREGSNLQLCVMGCPRNERINYRKLVAQKHIRLKGMNGEMLTRTMSRDEAVSKCREANVVDFYFDSCVFDLMTTGDTNFTVAAHKAFEDILRLHPEKKHTNRTHVDLSYSNNAQSLRTTWHSLHTVGLTILGVYVSLLTNFITSTCC